MNCFNHNKIAAIGNCKYCSKGLCPECSCMVKDSMLCCANNPLCNERVKEALELYEIQVKNTKDFDKANKQVPIMAIFFLLFGFLQVAFTLYSYYGSANDWLSISMGMCFIILGLFWTFRKNKMRM